jgi:tetratricopeptide (TPR) repeat protein
MRTARQELARQLFDETAWKEIRQGLRQAMATALKQVDSDPATHLAAGDRALARGEYDTAVRCMYRAVDLDPSRTDSLRSLAVALVAARRFDEVVPVYEAILGAAPADPAGRFNLALALSRIRDFGRAETEYRKLLAEHEDHVRGWYNLATLYQAQGKLHDAMRTWKEVVRLAPQLPSAHACLGEVLLDLGKRDEAMLAYAEAAKLRPKEVGAWLNLAAAARAAGSYGRAVLALQRATQLAPEDADVWARLGETLIELHRATDKPEPLAEAVEAWRRSLQLDADQTELRRNLRIYESVLPTQPASAPAR